MAAPIVPDNHGRVGFAVHPASLRQIHGAVLMTAGLALVVLL
ncbi:hypothetical protein [Methylobacterium sp. J-077]|nr:hypothetical protein [Methylobacterium sp. J-077]